MDIRRARKSRRLSQHQLARLAGLEQGNLSKMEAGKVNVSEAAAKRLSDVLGVSSFAIKVGNRAQAVQESMSRGDAAGVLAATRSIVLMAKDLPEDPKLDAMVNRLVEQACKFAQGSQSVVDPEEYGQEEGRVLLSASTAVPLTQWKKPPELAR